MEFQNKTEKFLLESLKLKTIEGVKERNRLEFHAVKLF